MKAAQIFLMSVGLSTLVGCMEAQPAPDLSEVPSSEFQVDVLADNLKGPWSVAPLPDGGALITQKSGLLLQLSTDGTVAEVVGLPEIYYIDNPQSQAGLFDVVLASDFAESSKIYLSYAAGTAEANATALSSARINGKRLEDVTEIFRGTDKDTNAHFGAKILPLPDGSIALSTGDGFTYREAAQDIDSYLGKIIRVNADGSIPADNPFREGEAPAVISYGHRNVQGLALDRDTGLIWEHEHGPRGGDELNSIEVGANYGWPVATTGRDYNGAKISPFDVVEGFTPYVHQWTPSVAPSGLVIYRGDLFPEWQGDALVGALAGKSLRRIDLNKGEAVGEEILLGDLKARIRDVREAPDGSIWVLTNEGDTSRLLRLSPKAPAG